MIRRCSGFERGASEVKSRGRGARVHTSEVKGKVKGDGQECPSYTERLR